jgi:hypothetical protein
MSQEPKEEGIGAHIVRVCRNSCTKCFGAVQTTDEYAKIKYKEFQIENRKKQFGVDFYKLVVNKDTTEQAKQDCINAVLADTKLVEGEIEALKLEIQRVDQATKEKIVQKPGAPVAAAAPTASAAAATTVAQPPPPPQVQTQAAIEAPVSSSATGGVEVTTTAPPTTATTIPDDMDPTMQEVSLTTPTTTTN